MADDPRRADVHLTELPRAAGGLGAVWSTANVRREGLRSRARQQGAARDEPGRRLRLPRLRVARAGQHRARFEFCENGAKALAEEATHRARARPSVFAAPRSTSCALLSELRARPARPHHASDGARRPPLPARSAGTTRSRLSAAELRAAGPERASFYTSGRTSNEAAFLYQLVGRMFGTNNFPDCSNMCHESSGVALLEVVGVGKGTVSLSDFEHADLIFVDRPEPGHEPPAHADDAARGRAARRDDRRRQSAARGRADAVRAPAEAARYARRWRAARERLRPGPDRRRPGVLPRHRQGRARARRRTPPTPATDVSTVSESLDSSST